MDKLKQQIRQRLIANILAEKCAQSEHLIFRDAWCTQERVLRFTTPFFRKLFSVVLGETGKWKTGDCVMYEVHNGTDAFTVNCVLNCPSVPVQEHAQMNALLKAVGTVRLKNKPDVLLKVWELSQFLPNTDDLFNAFDRLFQKEIPYFEQALSEKMNTEPAEQPALKEGAEEQLTLNKYERNTKARAACLAAHGTACAVCGIDFGKAYGPEFAGKIEVHHIVPLSEIGEQYVVDPVKDLIPVCPNCHTALHSKKGGVYTVEELK